MSKNSIFAWCAFLLSKMRPNFYQKQIFPKLWNFAKGTICVTLFFHAMFHKKTGKFHVEKISKNQFLKNINGLSAQEKNM